MKGVVFTGDRRLELREFPDPAPGGDEVVIEIRASGMCGSDLHVYRTAEGSPFIAGHEPCGVVVARGNAVPERMARRDARVMVHHYDGCRCCPNCLSGWTQLCDEGSVVYGRSGHGAHARYMKIPARTLVSLEQVNDQRYGDRGTEREVKRVEETHQPSFSRLWRYARSASAIGWSVPTIT